MAETTRVVRVVSVQMESQNGQLEANLEHAVSPIEQAAQKGGRRILLPTNLTGQLPKYGLVLCHCR